MYVPREPLDTPKTTEGISSTSTAAGSFHESFGTLSAVSSVTFHHLSPFAWVWGQVLSAGHCFKTCTPEPVCSPGENVRRLSEG